MVWNLLIFALSVIHKVLARVPLQKYKYFVYCQVFLGTKYLKSECFSVYEKNQKSLEEIWDGIPLRLSYSEMVVMCHGLTESFLAWEVWVIEGIWVILCLKKLKWMFLMLLI